VGSCLIDLSDLTIRLLKCANCKFQFTHPRIPPERLLACYEKTSATQWGIEVDIHHRQYDVIRRMLEKNAPGKRILDVGCFAGSLLGYLGETWDRNGIEPSVAAAEQARRAGLKILGATLDDIPANFAPFDAVTAIDVVEHIAEPMPFFRKVREVLKPGGILVIVTGDTESLTWRIMKNRYWYCSLPEHLSFYSGSAMAFLETQLNFQRLNYEKRRHVRSHLLRHVKMLSQNVFYELGVAVRGLGIPSLRRITVDAPGRNWITARDHMFYVARRQ
jgi:SAM-dependent methyltransferase